MSSHSLTQFSAGSAQASSSHFRVEGAQVRRCRFFWVGVPFVQSYSFIELAICTESSTSTLHVGCGWVHTRRCPWHLASAVELVFHECWDGLIRSCVCGQSSAARNSAVNGGALLLALPCVLHLWTKAFHGKCESNREALGKKGSLDRQRVPCRSSWHRSIFLAASLRLAASLAPSRVSFGPVTHDAARPRPLEGVEC